MAGLHAGEFVPVALTINQTSTGANDIQWQRKIGFPDSEVIHLTKKRVRERD